jgi:tetratricopeptide (TPR) repeat protein
MSKRWFPADWIGRIRRAGCFGLLSFFVLAAFSCQRDFSMETAESIIKMQNPVYKDKPVPAHVVADLTPLVQSYKQRVTEYADNADKLQLLYKNVAQRYLDIGYYEQQIEYYTSLMAANKTPPAGADNKVYYDYAALMLMQKRLYSEAYDNLQKSLALAPDNTFLLYYSGYCAALRGKAIRPENESEGRAWLEKALRYYDLALAIDSDYVDTLYGKAVLLVYELNRPAEAVPVLLHLKEKSTQNMDALFVLAAAYAMTENYPAARSEYESIERMSGVDAQKKAARENIEKLRGLTGAAH